MLRYFGMRREFFPLWRNRTIGLYYVLNAVYNCWFVAGVWAFVWGMFMTKAQIGLSDSLTFALGFLIELPAGAIADVIGRKRTVIFGNLALVIGNVWLGLSGSFWGITLAYAVWTIGWGFQSGATEALVYDYVKSIGKVDDWPRIRAAAGFAATILYPVCIALGGVLFTVWFRLPYLALAAVGVVGVVASFMLVEANTVHAKERFSWVAYGARVKDGVRVLFSKLTLPVSLAALAVLSLQIVYSWGLLRPFTYERFGYTQAAVPQIMAVVAIVSAISLLMLDSIRKKVGTVRLLFVCAFVYAFAFASLYASYNWLIGAVVLTIVAISATYVEQLFSVFINRHAHDRHRATSLSAVNLITRAPYALLAIVTGTLAEHNLLGLFSLIAGLVVMAFVAAGTLLLSRSNTELT